MAEALALGRLAGWPTSGGARVTVLLAALVACPQKSHGSYGSARGRERRWACGVGMSDVLGSGRVPNSERCRWMHMGVLRWACRGAALVPTHLHLVRGSRYRRNYSMQALWLTRSRARYVFVYNLYTAPAAAATQYSLYRLRAAARG